MPEYSSRIYDAQGWVIGVGASAGGLEALSQFVGNLPENFKGSIVVAQHLAPHSKSMMVELLARQTPLKVEASSEHQKFEPGVIYVIPPNHDADVVDGHMILNVADDRTRPKPSIDELFQSLARARGNRSVGIILSGTGTDGSKGIRAIKVAGGITLAQDDRSAKYDGMPRSAVDTGSVDSILPPEVIARSLPDILADHEARIKARTLDPQGLKVIFDLIKEKLGQDFRHYKTPTIQRRIVKRMAFVGAPSFNDYHDLLKRTPSEISELAQELLISVTTFFRDPEVFTAFTQKIGSRMEEKPSGEEMRVWVAGCATGEEAYTIAMILLGLQEQIGRNIPVKIFATDLDHEAILEARAGIYSANDLETVPSEYRDRFFQRRDHSTYEVTKQLRDVVVFARQDLIQNPPFVKLDAVSCRNVMIYFQPDLQKRILEIFSYSLAPGGLLLLGKSESTLGAPLLFETLDKKAKIFEKRNLGTRTVPSGPLRTSAPIDPVSTVRRRHEQGPSLTEMGYRKLLAQANVSGVIVDSDATLLQVLGNVSQFVQFFNSSADLKLPNLLPKAVGLEVPILLRKAIREGGMHKSRTHRLGKGSKSLGYYLVVQPLQEPEENEAINRPTFLVSFEMKRIKEPTSTAPTVSNESLAPTRLSEIEQELFLTREHLQTVIEELGVSNEELQSLNEELSSTNEELQATNEELETTNEELQSSNEELTTVNEEVNAKSSELRSLNLSLENIQNSIGSPMIVVDSYLRISRYNSDALQLFHISQSDVGREITKVSSTCEIPEFQERVRDAIENGRSSECVCESTQRIYQLRIMPCFDESKKIIGAVLNFIDNTDRIRIQERLSLSEGRIRAIIDGSSSHVFLKDTLGRYLLVNEAYSKFIGVDQDRIIGRTDRELLPENIANQFRDADLEVLVKRTPARREETLSFNGKRYSFFANRFPIYDKEGNMPYATGTISVDITAQVEAQEALQKSETRYRAIVEDQGVFVCRYQPDGTLTYTNALFSNFFGGTPQLNLGQNIYRIFPAKEKENLQRALESIDRDQPICQFEQRVSRLGSEPRWVRWIHRGIFDSEGSPVEYQSVGFDVTEYRNQTDELIQKDAVFGGIFNNTSDFITVFRVVNGEFVVESLNRSAQKSLGVAYTQLIGKRLVDFLGPEQGDGIIEHYNRVLETQRPEAFDEVLQLPGGIRYFSTTLVPIPGPNGQIERIGALSRDVSGYKNIESDLRRAKDGAEIANRAKSDFLASMSHELRTPLNVVLGLCQILEHGQLDNEQKSYVQSIHRSGKVLLSLIEDILDIAKIEAGKVELNPTPFNLKEVTKEVVDLFALQASEKRVGLELDVDNDADESYLGDAVRLRQIVLNLVSNALKFTDQGRVSLSLKKSGTAENGDPIFKFTVKDTGIGIRKEDHSKIFERFSQVESGHSRRYGGTGLGLVISKHLVVLMKGEIGFESTWGTGSEFWFTIRLRRIEKAELLQKKGPKATPVNSDEYENEPIPLRVLAVDDNRESQKVIELFLKKLGHDCDVATTGEEALALLRKPETYDIVLMDVQMPGMDGYETTQRVRRFTNGNQGLPIVALTANAMTGDAEKCLEAGMDDYLTKPMSLESLQKMLQHWARKIRVSQKTI